MKSNPKLGGFTLIELLVVKANSAPFFWRVFRTICPITHALKRGAGQPLFSLNLEEAAAGYECEPEDALSPDNETLRQFNATGPSDMMYREVANQLGARFVLA